MEVLRSLLKQSGDYDTQEEEDVAFEALCQMLSLHEVSFEPRWDAPSGLTQEELEDAESEYTMGLLNAFVNSESYQRLNERGHAQQMADFFLIHTLKRLKHDPFRMTLSEVKFILAEIAPVMGDLGVDPPSQHRELAALFRFAQRELMVDLDEDVIGYINSPDALAVLYSGQAPVARSKPTKNVKKKAKAKRKRARASRKKNKRK